jgi:glycerol kinase
MQADLIGRPMVRYPDTDKATLRGAAFLAGVGALWGSLEEAVATMPAPARFEPVLSEDARRERTAAWRAVAERGATPT